MQSARHVLEISPETLHDADGVTRHNIVCRSSCQDDDSERGDDIRSALATTGNELLEAELVLTDKGFEIGRGRGVSTPGAAVAAPAAVWLRRDVLAPASRWSGSGLRHGAVGSHAFAGTPGPDGHGNS